MATNLVSCLYGDAKFSRIVYYLTERGIVTIDDLEGFSFEELLLIPGVSNVLVSEAIELYISYIDGLYPSEFQNLVSKTINSDAPMDGMNRSGRSNDKDIAPEHPLVEIEQEKDYSLIKLSELPLSVRAKNALGNAGIITLDRLLDRTPEDLLGIRNIGRKTCEEIMKFKSKIDPFSSKISKLNSKVDKESLQVSGTTSLSDTTLSVRAKNALGRAGISTLSQLLALTKEEILGIRNLGKKTLCEITKFIEGLEAYTELFGPYHIGSIADENAPIPLGCLEQIGLPFEKATKVLGCTDDKTLGDLYSIPFSYRQRGVAMMIEDYMSVPISNRFAKEIAKLDYANQYVLEKRQEGLTLQEIGTHLDITRERVRQLLVRICSQLVPISELVAATILSKDGVVFHTSELFTLLKDDKLVQYCKWLLKQSVRYRYLEFCDRFVLDHAFTEEVEQDLYLFLEEMFTEGTDFYDNWDVIQSKLAKLNINFLSAQDIKNFLLFNNFLFYGNYVIKKGKSYASVCYDAVVRYFDFKITLNNNIDNKDMHLLRRIIEQHYPGLELPVNNRALTGAMTRDFTKLILAGRSQYCPIEKVIFNKRLFRDIYNYIDKSEQTTFYYFEIFDKFQGRLLAETNIDEPQFLHGMLKYLYSSDFEFERDLMYKAGERRENVDDRINAMLISKGSSITVEEIQDLIPGVKKHVINSASIRIPKIIQWAYNEYNHMDNIQVTKSEKATLKKIIKDHGRVYAGYLSENILFDVAQDVCSDLLLRNKIKSPQNLFYVVAYMFANDFRFRRPHIVFKSFRSLQLSSIDILKVLLPCRVKLDYQDVLGLTRKIGWPDATGYEVFARLAYDYIRVSENEYINKEDFTVCPRVLEDLCKHLATCVTSSGYLAVASIFDYDSFPPCFYEWNGFLLKSIITSFDIGYRLIVPRLADRRYHNEIIVPSSSPYRTLEGLVLKLLRRDGIFSLTDNEFSNYLRIRGLITTPSVPVELYKGEKIRYRNGKFYFAIKLV